MRKHNTIPPVVPKGTRDFPPRDMSKRNFVLEKIRQVFLNFGYDTIETPVIEYAKTILGKYGDEEARLTYTFKDNHGRKLALRYDQTVPFARFVAANYRDLSLPFKRYQIARVWRADRPARGRYREFYQCDIDIIGTDSLLAECEIVKVIGEVLESLGLRNYRIKVNSRRLLNRVLNAVGVPENKHIPVIRILDKLEKVGTSKVIQLLNQLLPERAVSSLLEIVGRPGTNREKLGFLKPYSPEEIQEFFSLIGEFGIPEEKLWLDVSLARGLDYYTGITFEAVLPEVNLGPICAGGRYDDLCSAFCEETFSGVGAAFGFDRLMIAMEEQSLLSHVGLNSEVLVTYFSEATLRKAIHLVNELREAGIPTELYFQPDRLSKQIKYADRKGIPFVVICGPDEDARHEATIKVMKTGKQKTIPQNQLAIYLKGYQGV